MIINAVGTVAGYVTGGSGGPLWPHCKSDSEVPLGPWGAQWIVNGTGWCSSVFVLMVLSLKEPPCVSTDL